MNLSIEVLYINKIDFFILNTNHNWSYNTELFNELYNFYLKSKKLGIFFANILKN